MNIVVAVLLLASILCIVPIPQCTATSLTSLTIKPDSKTITRGGSFTVMWDNSNLDIDQTTMIISPLGGPGDTDWHAATISDLRLTSSVVLSVTVPPASESSFFTFYAFTTNDIWFPRVNNPFFIRIADATTTSHGSSMIASSPTASLTSGGSASTSGPNFILSFITISASLSPPSTSTDIAKAPGVTPTSITSTVTSTGAAGPSLSTPHHGGLSKNITIAVATVAVLFVAAFVTTGFLFYRKQRTINAKTPQTALSPFTDNFDLPGKLETFLATELNPFTDKDLPGSSQMQMPPVQPARIPRRERDAGPLVIFEDSRSESEGTLPPEYNDVFRVSNVEGVDSSTVRQNHENKI